MSTQIYETYTFLPTKISGCALWLDGADLTTLFTDIAGTIPVSASGQNVSYWKDKSTQANNATNSTNQPTVTYTVQNGQSVVTFNGSQYLSLAPEKLPNGSTNVSYFFVVRTPSSALQVFMANGTPATNQMLQCYFNSYNCIGDLYGGSAITDGTTYNNEFVVVSYTAGATFNGYDFNSLFSGTNAINITLNTGTTWALLGVTRITTPNPAFIYYLTGQIAEVIVYNRIVSTSEREQIQAYLGWKWNREANFTSAFTYKNNPPFMNTIQLPMTPTRPIQIFNTPVFVPTQVSGCQLWLDAADSTTVSLSGTTVTQWRDKSGQSRTATPIGTISYTAKINSLTAMSYPGAFSTYFKGALVNSGSTLTAFSVYLINSSSYSVVRILSLARDGLSDFNSTLYVAALQRSTNNMISFRNFTTLGTIAGSLNTPALMTTQFTGSSNTVFLNGNAGTTVASSGNFGYSNYVLGSSSGEESLVNLNGSIAEVIVYHSALSTTQRQQVEGYLAWKWGLQGSLPLTHPYSKSPFPNQTMAPSPAYPPRITSIQWLPNRISGMSLWLDAANSTAVVVSGSTISQWTDNTSSIVFTAVGSISYPSTKQNKLNTIPLNGTSQYFSSAFTINSATHTLLAVHKPTNSTTANNSLFRFQAIGNVNYIVFPYTNKGYITSYDGTAINFANSTLLDNSVSTQFNIIAATIASGAQDVFLNGTSQASTAEALTSTTSPILYIGAFLTPDGAFELYGGDIGEIIVYNSSLPARERQQVEGYLAWKWGLQGTLPSNHPYKLFPPQP
jgi:hypothetical protein